jgi:hypothetical protein
VTHTIPEPGFNFGAASVVGIPVKLILPYYLDDPVRTATQMHYYKYSAMPAMPVVGSHITLTPRHWFRRPLAVRQVVWNEETPTAFDVISATARVTAEDMDKFKADMQAAGWFETAVLPEERSV